ncbi:hypothetical protein [Methylocella sp.]|uniref:hypothetical protein n=1 Tax=Methylocella sp. TaxID=1978226 RepID=UPI003783EE4D
MTNQTILGPALNRRSLLAGATILGIAALLPGAARAQSGELVVSNWGGVWNERIAKGFEEPAFAASAMRIIHDLAPAPERKAKLLAECRLPRSSVDVTWLSDADAYEMSAQGVLETLDMSRIPSAGHIIEKLRRPYFIPAAYGGVVLIYNPARIPEPPTSFADL